MVSRVSLLPERVSCCKMSLSPIKYTSGVLSRCVLQKLQRSSQSSKMLLRLLDRWMFNSAMLPSLQRVCDDTSLTRWVRPVEAAPSPGLLPVDAIFEWSSEAEVAACSGWIPMEGELLGCTGALVDTLCTSLFAEFCRTCSSLKAPISKGPRAVAAEWAPGRTLAVEAEGSLRYFWASFIHKGFESEKVKKKDF